ncbi:MAG: hemerythrin domain-containing protein [Gammaproteobacteria bacterium]|nr:hemerythrin domain-containing protein [Gammaproteobacteria bacterium]
MFSRRVCQTLHDEHLATIRLVERLGALLDRCRHAPPDRADGLVTQLLRDIPPALESEVTRHFDFEEAHLFGYLAGIGDAAIGAHLTEEHEAMRPLGRELGALARAAAAGGFDARSWQAFQRVAGELCDRLLGHVQKEEMVLLPLLEDNLDPAADASLYEAYAVNC